MMAEPPAEGRNRCALKIGMLYFVSYIEEK